MSGIEYSLEENWWRQCLNSTILFPRQLTVRFPQKKCPQKKGRRRAEIINCIKTLIRQLTRDQVGGQKLARFVSFTVDLPFSVIDVIGCVSWYFVITNCLQVHFRISKQLILMHVSTNNEQSKRKVAVSLDGDVVLHLYTLQNFCSRSTNRSKGLKELHL